MFERVQHELARNVLEAFDKSLLVQTASLFAGGTALTLLLGEYRESRNITFLIGDPAGYQALRKIALESGLTTLLPGVPVVGTIKMDRFGVHATVSAEGLPIKIEFIEESRIGLSRSHNLVCGVRTLDRSGLYAEKLLANVDRVNDRSASGRDAIDLAAMIAHWGEIPPTAWRAADLAYGEGVARAALGRAATLFEADEYLSRCLTSLQMPLTDAQWVLDSLCGALPQDGPAIETRKRPTP